MQKETNKNVILQACVKLLLRVDIPAARQMLMLEGGKNFQRRISKWEETPLKKQKVHAQALLSRQSLPWKKFGAAPILPTILQVLFTLILCLAPSPKSS